MNIVGRKERGNLAAEWVQSGIRQAEDMGGEELLSCRFFLLEESWRDAGVGLLPTEVRLHEDPEVLDVLLDRLLDRFEQVLPRIGQTEALQRFQEQIRWFGPEMAEEY